MADMSGIQQISLEILLDPQVARQHGHLDLLELENSTLSQLHPLAQVISLHERGSTARISKKMLQNAAKSIILSGSCGICSEDDGDPDPIYNIVQLGRGSFSADFSFDSIYMEEIRVEFQLAFKMNGETVDGDALGVAVADKVSLTVKDLPLAGTIKTFEEDRKWLESLLSAKSKISASLSPGGIYLCGDVDINLEAVNLVMDDRILATLFQPSSPVASLRYIQGELVDTQLSIPIDESSGAGATCFWPKWLPAVAEELILQAEAFYRHHLTSETDDDVIKEIHGALLSVGELCRDPQCDELRLDVEELLDISNCSEPRFRDVSFDMSQKKLLPVGFNAEKDLGLACLQGLLVKLAEISTTISIAAI